MQHRTMIPLCTGAMDISAMVLTCGIRHRTIFLRPGFEPFSSFRAIRSASALFLVVPDCARPSRLCPEWLPPCSRPAPADRAVSDFLQASASFLAQPRRWCRLIITETSVSGAASLHTMFVAYA